MDFIACAGQTIVYCATRDNKFILEVWGLMPEQSEGNNHTSIVNINVTRLQNELVRNDILSETYSEVNYISILVGSFFLFKEYPSGLFHRNESSYNFV